MRSENDIEVKLLAALRLVCVPILLALTSSALAAEVEWHTIGNPTAGLPVPTNLVLTPANPSTNTFISFVAPANDDAVYFNSVEAGSIAGDPLISVDPTHEVVSVAFTPPTYGPVPLFVMLVSGVDGFFGPLAAGNWTFQVVGNSFTNSYTFTVAAPPSPPPPPPPVRIAMSSNQVALSWPASATNCVLQISPDLSPGGWSNVSNCVFASSAGKQAAFFRLQTQ
jgi:hypothetical protein